jgi:hypothetical protein
MDTAENRKTFLAGGEASYDVHREFHHRKLEDSLARHPRIQTSFILDATGRLYPIVEIQNDESPRARAPDHVYLSRARTRLTRSNAPRIPPRSRHSEGT